MSVHRADRARPSAPATRSTRAPRARFLLPAAVLATLPGCVLTPPGTKDEQARLDKTGIRYDPPYEERQLPELPASPTWRDVLKRALWANGELEAAYFQWKSAMERVNIAGAYPNSNVSLGFSYMFSSERIKSFDRATFSAGFDPSMNLKLPVKVRQEAQIALDEAKVAGDRLRALKFDLQRKLLFAWADYTARDRSISAMRGDIALLRILESTTAASARAGGAQERLLSARIERERAESRLRDTQAEQDMARATLNAMLARDPAAPLNPDTTTLSRRTVAADDFALIAAAAETFPEVAMSVSELKARKDALELARLQWIPDINPVASFTGTVAQAIGAAVTLPTTIPAIRAGIRAAEADVRAGQATVRQKKADRIGEYIALLITYRRAEERTVWIEHTLRPAIESLGTLRTTGYRSGAGELMPVLEARRLLAETDIAAAESWAQAEKALVEIECCLGVDIETLEQPDAPPTPAAPAAQRPTSLEHNHG